MHSVPGRGCGEVMDADAGAHKRYRQRDVNLPVDLATQQHGRL